MLVLLLLLPLSHFQTVGQMISLIFFKKEHDWLFARDGKLGCTICRKIGGLASVSKTGGMKEQLSPEWTTCSINCSGTTQLNN